MSICMVSRLDEHQCPSNVKTPIYSLLNFLFLKPLKMPYFLVLNPKFSVLTNFDLPFPFLVLTEGKHQVSQKRDKGLFTYPLSRYPLIYEKMLCRERSSEGGGGGKGGGGCNNSPHTMLFSTKNYLSRGGLTLWRGRGGWNSFLLRKIQVYNINYALLVRSQGVLSRIVATKTNKFS